MAHQIMKDDTMFSARGITPWHGLGRVLDGAPANAREAIEAAGLDWAVTLAPVFAQIPGKTGDEAYDNAEGLNYEPAAMARATVRSDTGRVLGVVGTGFRVLQNRDAFAAFDPWVQSGVMTYETAGSLQHGAKVWILAKLATDSAEIGKGDSVTAYVLLAHGHDGTVAVRVKGTMVRVVCANTLAASLLDGKMAQRFTHRGDVASKAADAVASLDEVRTAVDRQAAQYRTLTEIGPKNSDAVLDYLAACWRTPGAQLIEGRKAPTVAALYGGGAQGAELDTARGTYWGLYNALTEYLTHHAGGDSPARAASRAESSAWGAAAGVMHRGISVAYALGHDLITPEAAIEAETSLLDTLMADHVAKRAA